MSEIKVPSASFAPITRSGVVFGLGKAQLLLMGVALLPTVFGIMALGDLRGALMTFLVWTLPLGILAAGSWRGRSILSMLINEGLFVIRRLGGQTRAIPSLRVKSNAARLAIPGAVGERVHLLPLIGVSRLDDDERASFVWDKNPKNPTATAVMWVQTDGWLLADDQVKAARVEGVNEVCKQLARMEGVERVALMARTYAASLDTMPLPAKIHEDSLLGEFTRAEQADLLSTNVMEGTVRRDMLIAVTISAKKAATEIADHGGGVDGVSHVLDNRLRRIADLLPACGVRLEHLDWLCDEGIRAAVRLAFDPVQAPMLIEKGMKQPASVPVVHYFDEFRDHLITNSGFHRSWWIERWPGTPVNAGILFRLVARDAVPRTVTQIWQGVDLHTTEKRFHNQVASHETAERFNKALGKPASVASKAERDDMALRHAEMQLGFGDVRYSGWVTVHAETLADLNKHTSWVTEAAAGMTINVSRGRQGATFVTACLPLGLRDGDE